LDEEVVALKNTDEVVDAPLPTEHLRFTIEGQRLNLLILS
jgi:hypothetical protein